MDRGYDLRSRGPPTLDTKALDTTTHVLPCQARFSQGGQGFSMTFGGEGVDLRLGSHPIAKELASLGLPKEPSVATWLEHMRGSFEAPQPL